MFSHVEASALFGGNPSTPSNPSITNCAAASLQARVEVARIAFTVLTSYKPDVLAKVISIGPDGAVHKQSAASMVRGVARAQIAGSLEELADLLDALDQSQAVAWGVCARDNAPVVLAGEETDTPGAISRTRKHFFFPVAPGVMMIDHDGHPTEKLAGGELRARLIAACPALADAPMLIRRSASAGITAADGRLLTDDCRHRIYIAVRDASAIPDAGQRLVTRLWAAGDGWFAVGRAGQALERTLVDAQVWQPERLDFAAAPVLRDGLSRAAGGRSFHSLDRSVFDLSRIELDATTAKRAAENKRAALKAVADACTAQRDAWSKERAPALAAARGITEAAAREVLARASARGVLSGDYLLTASDGRQVSVGELLDRPNQWHNARFADPLDADDDRRVAVAILTNGGRPVLFTHRHGGMRFDLMRQSARVQVGKGLRVQTTDAVLQVLRDRGELYDFGEGAIAFVSAGKARPVTVDWLTDHLGRVCEFYAVRKRADASGDEVVAEVREDAPIAVARAIIAKQGERGFRPLKAVITAPSLRDDGSILDRPGHDEFSGLLYVSDDPAPARVPVTPTVEDALAALAELWEPFAGFPIVDDVSRGVVLHGILSACLRAALPTAPGIGLDAPAAGTGKTLLGRCIGVLATGAEPAVLPPADTDDETRKRLFATLREGARVVLWDNVREPLGCASLDSFLTAQTFADRVLGSSETASLPNRALFIATGNNLRLVGDTCRRVFVARLDAQSEKPYARDFEFDPAQRVLAGRMKYVVAGLTIVRAYIAAGRPKVAKGRTASFEVWDDLVRQPICWLAHHVAQTNDDRLPRFDDPLRAAELAFESDPETTKHTALLCAWHRVFGGEPASVNNAISRHFEDDLLAALEEIGGQGGKLNTRVVGRWIERMQGRRIGGRWFVRGKTHRGVATWLCMSEGES